MRIFLEISGYSDRWENHKIGEDSWLPIVWNYKPTDTKRRF
jgi:hypothetical protein